MTGSNCERLTGRFAQMAETGLVDVKFLLRDTSEAILEEVCEEVSALLDARDNGEWTLLEFNDSHSPK